MMNSVKCQYCGKSIDAEQSFNFAYVAMGIAIGTVIGGILPCIGLDKGALFGAKIGAEASKCFVKCLRCGRVNEVKC